MTRDVVRALPDVENAQQVEGLLPEGAGFGELSRHRSCVVDQDIEALLLVADTLEQMAHLLVVGVVAGDSNAIAACLGHGLGGALHRSTERMVLPPSLLRPVTYTVAPAAPRAMAIPFPTPRLAPVTTATLCGLSLIALGF